MRMRLFDSLGLQGKLIALVLLALMPLLVLDAVRIYARRNASVEREITNNQELAEALRAGFLNYLESLWTAEYALGQAITNHPEPLTNAQVAALLRNRVPHYPDVVAFAWLGPDGTVLASSDATAEGTILSNRDGVLQILAGRDVVVTDLISPVGDGALYIGVLRAVYRPGGSLAGIMLARVDVARLTGVLPLDRDGMRSFGLVDSTGTVVYGNRATDLPLDRRKAPPDSPVWAALEGNIGRVREYVTADGKRRMGVAVPIDEIGWAVFATASVNEILAEASAGAVTDFVVVLLVGGASVLAALALGRRFTRPLVRLRQAAAALESGDLTARVSHFGTDELGVTAQVFDHMAGHMEESEHRLHDRLREHEALGSLGALLLTPTDTPIFLDAAVSLIRSALRVEFCEVLALQPGDRGLRLQAGSGWKPGWVGRTEIAATEAFQPGFTLMADEPVVVTDLRSETRFQATAHHVEHGVVSGISVVIPGAQRPYGVLGAYTAAARSFTPDDAHFLQDAARILAAAGARRNDERRLDAGREVARILAESRSAEEAWPQVLRAIAEGLDWDVAVAWTVDVTADIAHCTEIWHREGEALANFAALRRQLVLQVGAHQPGWIAVSSGWTEDVTVDSRYIQRDVARAAGLHAACWVPVVLNDQVHGFIECYSREARFEDEAMLHSMVVLGSQMGQFIKRKRAEEELRALNVELEHRVAQRTAELADANQELESFSYSVSHDLRAPLRTINGFSLALAEDFSADLTEDGLDYLRRIRLATGRMEQLIDDLLRLSRLMRTEMRRTPVDLTRLAGEVAAELAQVHPQRQVKVAIQPGLMAVGDERLLRVVMENLLGNAWKFTARTPEPRVEVGAQQTTDGPVYFVRDNGAGFDMAYVAKIFVPFQRLHPTSEFEGHGIGLATVNRIIHRHRGTLRAEGAVGQGATFFFTLGREPDD